MHHPLSLDITAGADATHVRIAGDLDMATKDELAQTLAGLGVHARNLVLDLQGVGFMDSSGLTMLVDLHNRCVAAGGSLQLVGPTEQVAQVLQLTGLDTVLTVLQNGH